MHVLLNDTYIASTKFCQDAAKWPYIYLLIIWKSQDNFWGSIRPGLNVGTEVICLKTTATKINDLHLTSTVTFHQYILRLQVTMYQAKSVQKLKWLKTLNGNWLQNPTIMGIYASLATNKKLWRKKKKKIPPQTCNLGIVK